MPDLTTNYEFKKPLQSENYNVQVQNDNMDAIDAALTPTADPATADITTNGPFKLVKWVSIFTKLIKAITGKENWYTAPTTTIEALNIAMGTKADASDLGTHLAKTVSYLITATRDLTVEGTQTISGLPFQPKSINVIGFVTAAANKKSTGFWSANNQSCMTTLESTGLNYSSTAAISISADGYNYVRGVIGNITSNSFDITWIKTGTGATGTVQLILQIGGHY